MQKTKGLSLNKIYGVGDVILWTNKVKNTFISLGGAKLFNKVSLQKNKTKSKSLVGIQKYLFYFLPLSFLSVLNAQDYNFDNVSGGFESTSQWYRPDATLGFEPGQERFRSNNYLRADYTLGKLTTFIQFESYLPKALLGYSDGYNANKIAMYQIRYHDKKLDIAAGFFYDQFGSGLLLRMWEDRQIGINNALKGIRIAFTPNPYTTIKGLVGKQRTGFETTAATLHGIDIESDLWKIFDKESRSSLTAGLSYTGIFETYMGYIEDYPTTVGNYSVRLDYNAASGFYFGMEYVTKGDEPLQDGLAFKHTDRYGGTALLLHTGYSFKGFGISTVLRRLENMAIYSERSLSSTQKNPYNEGNINYLPALTKQHDYLLTNIYVYQAQAKLDPFISKQAGEIGGQLDLFYSFKKGSFLGGKYGTKIALNASLWYGLRAKFKDKSYKATFLAKGEKYFHDFNIELYKKWTKKWRTTITYLNVFYNKSVLEGGGYNNVISNIVVAEVLYTINSRNSLRLEGQYLQTKQDKKNWAAVVLEYGLGNRWSFHFSDMYNYGNSHKDKRFHYYNAGGSYTKGSLRASLNYGRQRGGLICVGGVCRYVPESKGFTLSIAKTF